MATAKNRAQYVDAWREHILQLASVVLAAKVPYQDWCDANRLLLSWVERAADEDFGPEVQS